MSGSRHRLADELTARIGFRRARVGHRDDRESQRPILRTRCLVLLKARLRLFHAESTNSVLGPKKEFLGERGASAPWWVERAERVTLLTHLKTTREFSCASGASRTSDDRMAGLNRC